MKNSLLVIFCTILLISCARPVSLPATPPPPPPVNNRVNYDQIKQHSYRARSAPYVNRSRYEGSLWKNEASWGNLLRDQRARYKGDLVKITGLQDVISLPEKKEPPPTQPARGLAAVGEQAAAQITEVLEAVTGMSDVEEEQNQVLMSLKSISALIKSVLPNGNMLIVGEKIDYRQQNSIRYVTTVRGIIRPSDVNDNNEVPALKLARFEAKIKRQMLSKSLKMLAPIIGTKKAGLLDRISHMATPSRSGAIPVGTK